MRKLFLFLILQSLYFYSAGQTPAEPFHYHCYKVSIPPIIDGNIEDSVWNAAPKSSSFMDIEGKHQNPPYLNTWVKMLWSDSFLYIAAYMEEPHLWAQLRKDESIMFHDNDFEIFIDPDGDMQNYYEYEFNQLNKKWDLFLPKAYRNFGKPIFEFNTSGLKHAVKLYGSLNNPLGEKDSCWTMEIAIPLYTLAETLPKRKHPSTNSTLRINFSRVEWETKWIHGKYVKLKKPEHNWVWSPQHKINMHRPEYWGYVHFMGNDKILKSKEKDKDWKVKLDLFEVYYAQLLQYKKTGAYARKLSELKGRAFNSTIELSATPYQFTASIKGETEIWFINSEGKLWQKER